MVKNQTPRKKFIKEIASGSTGSSFKPDEAGDVVPGSFSTTSKIHDSCGFCKRSFIEGDQPEDWVSEESDDVAYRHNTFKNCCPECVPLLRKNWTLRTGKFSGVSYSDMFEEEKKYSVWAMQNMRVIENRPETAKFIGWKKFLEYIDRRDYLDGGEGIEMTHG
jgi:hypothetical protein